MGTMLRFTCDGCGETDTVEVGKRPSDWKAAVISWEGLAGYPTNLTDGTGRYDLCARCARHLISSINPLRWPRAVAAAPSKVPA